MCRPPSFFDRGGCCYVHNSPVECQSEGGVRYIPGWITHNTEANANKVDIACRTRNKPPWTNGDRLLMCESVWLHTLSRAPFPFSSSSGPVGDQSGVQARQPPDLLIIRLSGPSVRQDSHTDPGVFSFLYISTLLAFFPPHLLRAGAQDSRNPNLRASKVREHTLRIPP